MLQTKLTCDGSGLYFHSYKKEERLLDEAISNGWWQIETHPGTLAISQPVNAEQIKSEAKHACSPECAKSIIEAWAQQVVVNSRPEKDEIPTTE